MPRNPSTRVLNHRFGSASDPLMSKGSTVLQKTPLALEKKDWKDAICPVCLEHPHNSVLLLCSSYDQGCLTFMCGTGRHDSNCLKHFQKAYSKLASQSQTELTLELPNPVLAAKRSEEVKLSCPLCRGEVKGWTVVEPAREYLNSLRRNCAHDGCSFKGTYKQLKRHMRMKHISAKPPWEVDPVQKEKWNELENEREIQDVMSTIRSTMPGSLVIGDYVIDMGSRRRSPEISDSSSGSSNGNARFTDDRLLRRSLFHLLMGRLAARPHATRALRSPPTILEPEDEEEQQGDSHVNPDAQVQDSGWDDDGPINVDSPAEEMAEVLNRRHNPHLRVRRRMTARNYLNSFM